MFFPGSSIDCSLSLRTKPRTATTVRPMFQRAMHDCERPGSKREVCKCDRKGARKARDKNSSSICQISRDLVCSSDTSLYYSSRSGHADYRAYVSSLVARITLNFEPNVMRAPLRHWRLVIQRINMFLRVTRVSCRSSYCFPLFCPQTSNLLGVACPFPRADPQSSGYCIQQ